MEGVMMGELDGCQVGCVEGCSVGIFFIGILLGY